MLTTGELIHPSSDCALVDRMVSGRFLPKHPYGQDFTAPFGARSWDQREAVVCAVIQVLLGPEADRSVGRCGWPSKGARPCRPFLEILGSVQRNPHRLWGRIRRWPGPIQDRAREAARLLGADRSASAARRRTPARPAAL
jgi:hypothetical protein